MYENRCSETVKVQQNSALSSLYLFNPPASLNIILDARSVQCWTSRGVVFRFQAGKRHYLFSTTPRLALGLTRTPTK